MTYLLAVIIYNHALEDLSIDSITFAQIKYPYIQMPRLDISRSKI